MKSIKEKAEEHLRESNTTQYEYQSYIEGADFGANYVLDAIQTYVITEHYNLKYIIEQLKK